MRTELHVKLHLRDAGTHNERVTVSADAQYFPAFVGNAELEVCMSRQITSFHDGPWPSLTSSGGWQCAGVRLA